MGKPFSTVTTVDYETEKPRLVKIISDCIASLREKYELIIIEGAGSPAEVNLKDRDLANMHVARVASAPVLLVGDIDRGGVFASLVGTLELLDADERERIAALVINKFRGDVQLLRPGLEFLRARTGKPVLGVVPFVPQLRIADEDSVSLEDPERRRHAGPADVDIAVIRLPRISNYDEFTTLEREPGVAVRFAETPSEIRNADIVVLPGSKNTALDLEWVRASGFAEVLGRRARLGDPVLGICGGCQMLGETIDDPYGVESRHAHTECLGLLPLRTHFERAKTTAQVLVSIAHPCFLSDGAASLEHLRGYEIHMGVVEQTGDAAAPFEVLSRNGTAAGIKDGAMSANGMVVGTMIHGLFENVSLRAGLLDFLRRRKGISAPRVHLPSKEVEYDRLEAAVRENIDRDLLWRLTGLRSR